MNEFQKSWNKNNKRNTLTGEYLEKTIVLCSDCGTEYNNKERTDCPKCGYTGTVNPSVFRQKTQVQKDDGYRRYSVFHIPGSTKEWHVEEDGTDRDWRFNSESEAKAFAAQKEKESGTGKFKSQIQKEGPWVKCPVCGKEVGSNEEDMEFHNELFHNKTKKAEPRAYSWNGYEVSREEFELLQHQKEIVDRNRARES